MPSARVLTKRLSTHAHTAVLKRVAERDRLSLLCEALSQSIERVIEQDTHVNLDRENWTLNLEAGTIECFKDRTDARE